MKHILFAAKLMLVALFLVLTNHDIESRIVAIGVTAGLFVFIFIWLSFIACYLLIAVASSWKIRFFWGLIFFVSALSAESYFLASGGESLSIFTIESLLDARGDYDKALSFYSYLFMIAFGKSVIGLIGIMLPVQMSVSLDRRIALLGAMLLPALPITAIAGILYMRGGEGTIGLPAQIKPITEFTFSLAYAGLANETVQREKVTEKQVTPPMVDNIIMIVDESVRSDYLDINSGNGIRTHLTDQLNRVVNFGRTSSAASCSHYSNAVLRYGGTFKGLPGDVLRNPSVWAYAKNAGLSTYFIEGQQYLIKEHDEYIDTTNIDRVISRRELLDPSKNEYRTDINSIEVIRKLISQPGKKFIYLVKQGSHFPYEGNYPRDYRPYKPFMSQESISSPQNQVTEDKLRVENSYKNVLSWGVGEFFKEFMKLDLRNTVVLYTSDHGQKLYNEGGGSFFTHCNTTNVDPHEGLVPLVVISDSLSMTAIFNEAGRLNYNRASHLNIYPTVLKLLGYDDNFITEKYGNTLFSEIKQKQEFIAPPFLVRYGRKLNWVGITAP